MRGNDPPHPCQLAGEADPDNVQPANDQPHKNVGGPPVSPVGRQQLVVCRSSYLSGPTGKTWPRTSPPGCSAVCTLA